MPTAVNGAAGTVALLSSSEEEPSVLLPWSRVGVLESTECRDLEHLAGEIITSWNPGEANAQSLALDQITQF